MFNAIKNFSQMELNKLENQTFNLNPANINLIKVNNRNIRKRSDVDDVNDVGLVFFCSLWTYFTLLFQCFNCYFEQVNNENKNFEMKK